MSPPSTISLTCSCGRTFQALESTAGKRVRCPNCDKAVRVPIPSLETAEVDHSSPEIWPAMVGDLSSGPNAIAAPPQAHAPAPRPTTGPSPLNLFEYKVLSRLDVWFSVDGLKPTDLEQTLNSYAAQGWVLHSILSVRVGEPKGEELIAILQRPV